MNIGKWIVVSFILFAAFIGALVFVCMRQDISLVSRNYYAEELQFEQQMERERNANELVTRPSIAVEGSLLMLAFNQPQPVTSGTVSLFCPANAKMDRTFTIRTNEDKQSFSLDNISKGMYRVKLRWKAGDKEFYQEEIINL